MKFNCNKNVFLSNMINMRNLKEITYSHTVSGKVIFFTNYEALNHFFKHADKPQLKEVQLLLNRDKFSVKSINEFAYNYGLEFFR